MEQSDFAWKWELFDIQSATDFWSNDCDTILRYKKDNKMRKVATTLIIIQLTIQSTVHLHIEYIVHRIYFINRLQNPLILDYVSTI